MLQGLMGGNCICRKGTHLRLVDALQFLRGEFVASGKVL